jgi:hypothetical protein
MARQKADDLPLRENFLHLVGIVQLKRLQNESRRR